MWGEDGSRDEDERMAYFLCLASMDSGLIYPDLGQEEEEERVSRRRSRRHSRSLSDSGKVLLERQHRLEEVRGKFRKELEGRGQDEEIAETDSQANSYMIYTGLREAFFNYLKISFVAGLILASPFVLYQIWKFISPGLYQSEKKYVAPFVIVASVLFAGGSLSSAIFSSCPRPSSSLRNFPRISSSRC